MKIYFCGSITAGRQDAELYSRLINKLKAYGPVLTEHVGWEQDRIEELENGMTDEEIHDRDIAWLTSSDVVIAEITQPSAGVGYEIGRAVAMNKRILILFRSSSNKSISAMVAGAHNGSTIIVKQYEEKDAPEIFRNFLGLSNIH